MKTEKIYTSAKAVEAAIKSRATKVNAENPELLVNDVIRQIHFDRFLSRVFSEGSESEWVLKGGSAMLARIPSTRHTLDIDMFRLGYDLDQSLSDLKRLADTDLHDFFKFRFISSNSIANGDNQPYLNGIHVSFEMFLGLKRLENINVDLVEHVGALNGEDLMEPLNRVQVGNLITFPYRLYPIANQLSDKVCAVVELVNGHESTRVKDLVDLVMIMTTQTFNASELYRALSQESKKRKLVWPLEFYIPKSWTEVRFKNIAEGTGAESYSLKDAELLVQRMLNRLYELGESSQAEWSPEQCKWMS